MAIYVEQMITVAGLLLSFVLPDDSKEKVVTAPSPSVSPPLFVMFPRAFLCSHWACPSFAVIYILRIILRLVDYTTEVWTSD